jgi:hypothetical protein
MDFDLRGLQRMSHRAAQVREMAVVSAPGGTDVLVDGPRIGTSQDADRCPSEIDRCAEDVEPVDDRTNEKDSVGRIFPFSRSI